MQAMQDGIVTDDLISENLLVPTDRRGIVAPGVDFTRAAFAHFILPFSLKQFADTETARVRQRRDQNGLRHASRFVTPGPTAETQDLIVVDGNPAFIEKVYVRDGIPDRDDRVFRKIPVGTRIFVEHMDVIDRQAREYPSNIFRSWGPDNDHRLSISGVSNSLRKPRRFVSRPQSIADTWFTWMSKPSPA